MDLKSIQVLKEQTNGAGMACLSALRMYLALTLSKVSISSLLSRALGSQLFTHIMQSLFNH